MKKSILAILATVAAISASAATVKDLSDKEVLTIDANTTWYGTTGQSPINVPGNTRAVINIKKGVTLTVYGADASGQTFGVPAIYVPRTATLYITGEGKLVAVGGNGDNGGNGRAAARAPASAATAARVQAAARVVGQVARGPMATTMNTRQTEPMAARAATVRPACRAEACTSSALLPWK